MILTGKCKDDFEKWHREQKPEMGHWYSIMNFNNLPNSMKYGVYVDFFEAYDILIRIVDSYSFDGVLKYYVMHSGTVLIKSKDKKKAWYFETRQQARTKAIEKANEIYNNN